jgi:hypothetical protein
MLSVLAGDITPITNYLMSGMEKLQKVSAGSETTRSSAQIICLVSGMVFGSWGIVSTNMIGVFSSQVTRV